MRIVIDTNVAVSGLLWGGPPNQLLRWARDTILDIVGCEETIDELRHVIKCKKFSERLSELKTTSNETMAYFMNLITFVPTPEYIPEAIHEDPFDNIFLALASESNAYLIISGDKHLLDFGEYNRIQIVTPSEAIRVIKELFK